MEEQIKAQSVPLDIDKAIREESHRRHPNLTPTGTGAAVRRHVWADACYWMYGKLMEVAAEEAVQAKNIMVESHEEAVRNYNALKPAGLELKTTAENWQDFQLNGRSFTRLAEKPEPFKPNMWLEEGRRMDAPGDYLRRLELESLYQTWLNNQPQNTEI